MTTLLERLEWILATQAVGQRELARRAGLGNEKNVGVLLHRLRGNPAATVAPDTLVKLARAAGVSLEWLATGDGPPTPVASHADDAPVYGNLPGWAAAEAVVRAKGRVPAWALATARAMSGFRPQLVTPEFVTDAAWLAYKHAPAEAVAQREDAALDRRIKALRTRATRAATRRALARGGPAAAPPPANDAPPARPGSPRKRPRRA